MYFVYILRSIHDHTFYKGFTDNLDRRLKEHFEGKSKTTRKMLPLELIHVELCATREDARAMELFFKSGIGRDLIKEIAK